MTQESEQIVVIQHIQTHIHRPSPFLVFSRTPSLGTNSPSQETIMTQESEQIVVIQVPIMINLLSLKSQHIVGSLIKVLTHHSLSCLS